jgi:hypothetical protein
MAIINIEARMIGSSEAQATVVRQFNVTAVLRGASASNSAGRPRPEPTPEQPKQGV